MGLAGLFKFTFIQALFYATIGYTSGIKRSFLNTWAIREQQNPNQLAANNEFENRS